MFGDKQSSVSGPAGLSPLSIALTDRGLASGTGAIIVRMTRASGGKAHLLIDDDEGRLVAMLSAAFCRRFAEKDIVPHVRAAAKFWANGDKALANLRLIFARFPQMRDHADARRLRLAEYLLDHGLSPDALMKDLGFLSASANIRKYQEDQPRVPAGFGEQSGRWTSDSSFETSRDAPVRFAEELPDEDEKTYEQRRLTGQTSRHEDLEHGHGEALRIPRLPAAIGPGSFAGKMDHVSGRSAHSDGSQPSRFLGRGGPINRCEARRGERL